MSSLYIPKNYRPLLGELQTEEAIAKSSSIFRATLAL